jgi:hypothetical protein
MATYRLARGTTFATVLTVRKAGALVNLTGHRILFTVRTAVVAGSSDAVPPVPVWQGDSAGAGLTIASPQSGSTLGLAYVVMPASVTQLGLGNPLVPTVLPYDVIDAYGSGSIDELESGTIVLLPRVTLHQP